MSFQREVEIVLGHIEEAYVVDGLAGAAKMCQQYHVDLSLLDCIVENEHGAWNRTALSYRVQGIERLQQFKKLQQS